MRSDDLSLKSAEFQLQADCWQDAVLYGEAPSPDLNNQTRTVL